jgi:hypothetical protein
MAFGMHFQGSRTQFAILAEKRPILCACYRKPSSRGLTPAARLYGLSRETLESLCAEIPPFDCMESPR